MSYIREINELMADGLRKPASWLWTLRIYRIFPHQGNPNRLRSFLSAYMVFLVLLYNVHDFVKSWHLLYQYGTTTKITKNNKKKGAYAKIGAEWMDYLYRWVFVFGTVNEIKRSVNYPLFPPFRFKTEIFFKKN